MDMKKIEKEIYQAVIFIDSDETFKPLTISGPKVLMRLINRPILEYNFDMLTSSGIQEVFVFCSEHSENIKNFVHDYNKKQNYHTNFQVFFSEDYTNLGSVMRDLDCKGLIKSDFILMYGDCVGNLRLDKLIEVHKQNMKKDPGCVMTCVFQRMSPNHQSRWKTNENPTLLLDTQQRFVFFEKNSKRVVNVPIEIFDNKKPTSIHYNLFDTQISICSVKVPPDFSDNFDFETRENFISGLLADIELLQHFIYAHILDDGYASRINSIVAYGNISCNILQRFLYPIVPDIENSYSYRRNNVYLQDKVHFNNKLKTMKNVAIGKDTSIGSDAIIINSVIGNNCKIGDNVQLINSYIFSNVKIMANSIIEECIIDSDVNIGKKCILKQSLISNNVIVDNKVRIENMKLMYDPDSETNKIIVGENGRGQQYENDNEDSDKDKEDYDECLSLSTRFSESSDESCSTLGDEYSTFFNEIYDSLLRGIEEKTPAENIILEINSSKHAYNVPMKEVNSLVIKSLFQLALNEKKNFFVILKSNLKYALPIIKNYIKNIDSQNDCIYAIEEFLLNNDEVSPLHLIKSIEYFYQESILEEDIILNWFYKPKILADHDTSEQKALRQSKEIGLFIKWLEEAEEESSEEED